jgi:hypothetical protein
MTALCFPESEGKRKKQAEEKESGRKRELKKKRAEEKE